MRFYQIHEIIAHYYKQIGWLGRDGISRTWLSLEEGCFSEIAACSERKKHQFFAISTLPVEPYPAFLDYIKTVGWIALGKDELSFGIMALPHTSGNRGSFLAGQISKEAAVSQDVPIHGLLLLCVSQ
jgi:hypothetical protein